MFIVFLRKRFTFVRDMRNVMKTQYPFLISGKVLYLEFEFESRGPRGIIEKAVRYELKNGEGSTFFELTLGDWNNETKQYSYATISNNLDRDKVLATVAATTIELTKKFPDLAVVAMGNTLARTRLYQIMISINLEAIKTLFNVYGYRNETWEPFKRNTKYEAFAVQRK